MYVLTCLSYLEKWGKNSEILKKLVDPLRPQWSPDCCARPTWWWKWTFPLCCKHQRALSAVFEVISFVFGCVWITDLLTAPVRSGRWTLWRWLWQVRLQLKDSICWMMLAGLAATSSWRVKTLTTGPLIMIQSGDVWTFSFFWGK